jgi:exodeoxyribonuclease VII small subunit
MAEAPKFEEGLAALEKLVAELEEGDLGLDEALKRFEKGVKLAAQMQSALEDTGRRIEKLGPKGLQDMEAGAKPGGTKGAKEGGGGADPSLF